MVGFLGKVLVAGVAVAGLALGGCAAVMSSCTVELGAAVKNVAQNFSVDDVVDAVGDGITQLGTLVLADPERVDGTLVRSEDGYEGTYRATFTLANQSRTLFGGTSLDGRTLKLTYDIEGTGGTARLVLRGTSGARTLIEADAAGTCTVELPAGSNYLRLELEGFTGTVELAIEETGALPSAAEPDGEASAA